MGDACVGDHEVSSVSPSPFMSAAAPVLPVAGFRKPVSEQGFLLQAAVTEAVPEVRHDFQVEVVAQAELGFSRNDGVLERVGDRP